MKAKGAAALFGLCLVIGCSSIGQMTAPPVEYSAYREFRVAATLESKLSAASSYLSAYPGGRFRNAVWGWFAPAEVAFWQRARGSLVQSQAYIQVLPGGPHAQAASERIQEFRIEAEFRKKKEAAFLARVHQIETELAQAERQRKDFLVIFSRFLTQLASIRSFGRPISDLEQEFLRDWQNRGPQPRCVSNRCTKSVVLAYAIPEDRQITQRTALFDVVLDLDDSGQVQRVTLTGPELFSRLYEAVVLSAVRPDDLQARIDAVARALDLVKTAIAKALPEERCASTSTSPAILARMCDHVRLQVIPAPDANAEDRVVVEPAP